MNVVRISVLALALVAAGAAAFLVRGLVLENDRQSANADAQAIETVGVLVASRLITPGETVRGGDLRWQAWPVSAVAEGQVTQTAQPNARTDYQGSIARRAFGSGEPIVPGSMVQPGEAGLMAALVSPGMRAMAVSVSDDNSAGGFILPGDRVDIVVTREVTQERGSRSFISETVLFNVRVLAIDQVFSEDVSGGALVGDTITLELSPAQSETLALAQVVGDVSLALRSFADSGMPEANNRPVTEVLASAASDPRGGQITVVRNGLETRVRVEGGGR
jgi:pilus assembly protein CpaB